MKRCPTHRNVQGNHITVAGYLDMLSKCKDSQNKRPVQANEQNIQGWRMRFRKISVKNMDDYVK